METINREIKIEEGLPRTCYYDKLAKHPMEGLKENGLLQEEQFKLNTYAKLFGTQYSMKLALERNILAQHRRLPGLKSSLLGLEIHMNTLNKIEFEDFLGKDDPAFPKTDIHTEYIKQFN